MWVLSLRGLGRDRLDDTRMAMPDRRHVVVAIEVAAPLVVKEPNPLATHEMKWLLIEEFVGRGEGSASAFR